MCCLSTLDLGIPEAIWILQPDSCCILEICSPPFPITMIKKETLSLSEFIQRTHLLQHIKFKSKELEVYLLNPTILSGTLKSSVVKALKPEQKARLELNSKYLTCWPSWLVAFHNLHDPCFKHLIAQFLSTSWLKLLLSFRISLLLNMKTLE